MNETIEANIAKEKALSGPDGDACYKTDKGWATVTKCRTRKTVTRKVGEDGKETAEETTETVVYLDTIGGRRARVKLPEAEVVKLERKPLAEASRLVGEAAPAAPVGVPAGTASPVTDDDQGDDEGEGDDE